METAGPGGDEWPAGGSASARLRRARRACGGAVAAIGLAALVGWITDLRVLAGVRASYIPMAPNTALAFVLMGTALAVRRDGRAGRWAAGLGAGLVGYVAVMRLLEFALRVDLAVDAWVLRVPSESMGLAPVGKMALPTAVLFLLSALSLAARLLRDPESAGDLAGVLSLIVAASGLVFWLGYLYQDPLMYGTRMIPMALNTAAAFTLLGAGLVAGAGPGALPLRPLFGPSMGARLLRTFLPLVMGTVVIVSWATHRVTTSARANPALVAALLAVVAVLAVASLCVRLAGRLGDRLERAEEDLRRAHDELEVKVQERTAELSRTTALLELRNQQLQQSAEELVRTAESALRSHEEAERAYEELKKAEAQLVQAEKLSALGRMVAGVAHEINNPLAFVANNVDVLRRDVGFLHDLIELYQQAESTLAEHQRELLARIRDMAETIDLPYVLDHLDGIMDRSREGLRRIQQIVKDLRNFARLDEGEFKDADLNEGVTTTLSILHARFRERGVELETDLAPLPPLACYPAKLNQVIMNLVSNAIDASPEGGKVTVITRPAADGGAEVHVLDTGPGVDPAVRDKIFDPFFTTKPIGQGTGLGLSISYGIVQDHGGTIDVGTAPGGGAHFTVYLPPAPPPRDGPPRR